jgi:hypothetical protein|tara:strand:+ start:1916 stop:2068 length:153 start_codon:yes stop_codon:yes gene_type:complete
MSDEKLTPSVLYTTEAKESKKKTDEELSTPDPEVTIAWSAIRDNTIDEEK